MPVLISSLKQNNQIERKDIEIDRYTARHTYRQTYVQRYRYTDMQICRYRDRQIYRYIDTQICRLERIIKLKFPENFLEPAYLVGFAYTLTENFGFGDFFSFLDG